MIVRVAEEITSFVNSIRSLTGVGICYYDLKDFFNYNEYGVKNNRGHYCEFCERARKLPNGRNFCERSDRIEAVELAGQYKEPFFYQCHMGMRELLIPIMGNDDLQGILFVGQCRIDDGYTLQFDENSKEFAELYNKLPLISKKDLVSIGKLISHYFGALITNNELLSVDNSPQKASLGTAETIKKYIQENYRYYLSLKTIVDELHINSSYASRCFSAKYNITVTEYISYIRTERAKAFLTSTEIPICNIALNVGFSDANYFSRVFKKNVGCSPSQYRQTTIK